MNYQEFLTELGKIKDSFKPPHRITGMIRTLTNNCPITAICFSVNGVHYTPTDYARAARELMLDPSLAFKIVCASDGVAGAIRSDILEVLCLKESDFTALQEEEFPDD